MISDRMRSHFEYAWAKNKINDIVRKTKDNYIKGQYTSLFIGISHFIYCFYNQVAFYHRGCALVLIYCIN